MNFYRAMHDVARSAKRGIITVSRLSVCLSVLP